MRSFLEIVDLASRGARCVYRAAEWRHKDVELAAHGLLQELDKASGLEPSS